MKWFHFWNFQHKFRLIECGHESNNWTFNRIPYLFFLLFIIDERKYIHIQYTFQFCFYIPYILN